MQVHQERSPPPTGDGFEHSTTSVQVSSKKPTQESDFHPFFPAQSAAESSFYEPRPSLFHTHEAPLSSQGLIYQNLLHSH